LAVELALSVEAPCQTSALDHVIAEDGLPAFARVIVARAAGAINA
jgi:hypothetical protein